MLDIIEQYVWIKICMVAGKMATETTDNLKYAPGIKTWLY